MTKKYTNIGLPHELIIKIDKIITEGNLGYTSRSELVKESVRDLLLKLADFKNHQYRRNKYEQNY